MEQPSDTQLKIKKPKEKKVKEKKEPKPKKVKPIYTIRILKGNFPITFE